MATDIIARGMAANAQAGGGVTEGTITNALGYKPVSETDVNNAINNSSHLKRVIVDTLPDVSKADKDTIYMIKVTSVKGDDKYQEYMLIDGSLQMIGDTSTDLTDYAKIDDVNSKLDTKVDKVEGKGLSTNDFTTAEQTKLASLDSSLYEKIETKGQPNGYASLDESGLIPSTQLPSYVDDVIEGYYNSTDGKFYSEESYTTEITGEGGKIYVDLSTNHSYRWGGSVYVQTASTDMVAITNEEIDAIIGG